MNPDFVHGFEAIGNYVAGLLALALLDYLRSLIRNQPASLVAQIRRLLGELRYLASLKSDPRLRLWKDRYVTLRAIRGRVHQTTDAQIETSVKGSTVASLKNSLMLLRLIWTGDWGKPPQPPGEPLILQIETSAKRGTQMVVLGEPGSGKSATLEAATHRFAERAYWGQALVWFFALASIGTLAYLRQSPRWLLLIFATPYLELLFRRWPVPVLVELRRYGGESIDAFLQKVVNGSIGGEAIAGKLRKYIESRRLVLLLDGVNEIKGDYGTALEGWRSWFRPGQFSTTAPVIFTSRSGEDPTGALGLKETVTVLDLDDTGVRQFLQAYGATDVAQDFQTLRDKNMLEEGGLGRNPYWLKILVTTGLRTRNRGALFENFARELIQRELDKRQTSPPRHDPLRLRPSIVPVEDELRYLGGLGLSMNKAHEVGASLKGAKEQLNKSLAEDRATFTSDDVLAEGEAASLMRLSERQDRADFVHQLVQEFLAAYALRLQPAVAFDYVLDRWWWETLLMLGGLVTNHASFTQGVLGDGGSPARILLAVGVLRSVDQCQKEVERQVLNSLVNSLGAGITEEHIQAAADLAKTISDDLADALGTVWESNNLCAREGAVALLKGIRTERGCYALVPALLYRETVREAFASLVAAGPLAIKPLFAALRSRPDLRRKVSRVLGTIGGPAVEGLIAALQDGDKEVRRTAVETLGKIGGTRTALLAALQDGDDDVRRSAVEALGKICAGRGGPLLAALQDSNPRVRRSAIEALEKLGDVRAVEPLLAVLHDSDQGVRRKAIEVLGTFRDARAVEPLLAVLRERDWTVINSAAEALGTIGDPRALQLLEELSTLQDPVVASAARQAIENIKKSRASRASSGS